MLAPHLALVTPDAELEARLDYHLSVVDVLGAMSRAEVGLMRAAFDAHVPSTVFTAQIQQQRAAEAA